MLRKLTVCVVSVLLLEACQIMNIAIESKTDSQSNSLNKMPLEEQEQTPEPIDRSYALIDDLESDVYELELVESSVAESDNLWWQIRQDFNLEVPDNAQVRAQRNWYARHPAYLKRVSERATPYLYYIVSELKQRNMPLELALLPIVESAYDPFAYSHGRASGMWQFIPGTGKRFGLNQNWWYDGRRDVYYSTQAALDYLQYLHKRFDGDWLHAVAAYNSGEGNVLRAIKRNTKSNRAVDFWSLSLPKETEAYVPKLLALADLLTLATAEKNDWTPIANFPYFEKVTVNSQIDLIIAAELAEIEMDEFYTLNPGFNHWATEPKKATDILLPVEHKERFIRALENTPEEQRVAFKRYIIKNGDSLLLIAKKFNTTVELLRENNAIRGNTIREGHALLIPTASQGKQNYIKSSSNRLAAKQNRPRNGQKVELFVQQGDSFWSISREHKVGMRELAGWNNMAPTDPLKIGQKLVVWTSEQKSSGRAGIKNKTRKIHYQVRRGDSIARIAGKFRVKVGDVLRWNKINPNKYLQPGQNLTLYVDITRQY